ncbi:phosphoribosylformylglycinamidine synthase subunit PurL [Bdellovibrio bacteriovorus]|uniref:Phosphoribosylformylglycinamidine synthase subunit PurL n=1 Tax=Bdellovibrio bacteriovorus str. Tiberius TaxID=1069642 RepID=K7ZGL1_BDEBC|nr:AIR synthase-related protein [Bdellovibrio bacteriovorus]AFY02612.1 phosphoribosylformylglycinamidine synthase II [Bdellovibrio bacteriovorus str. Tiberius]
MQRISVRSRYDHSTEKALKSALSLEAPVNELQLRRVYWLLEKKPGAAKEFPLQAVMDKVFFDPISEAQQTGFLDYQDGKTYVEIRFLAGVTDNIARTATEALMLFSAQHNSSWQEFPLEVHSGWEMEISGDISKDQIQKVLFQNLANPLLNKLEIQTGAALKQENSWAAYSNFWKASEHTPQLQLLNLDVETLGRINNERGLALSDEEIQTILSHFSSPVVAAERASYGWHGKITEVELECLAQTWSEHCKHKIFAAEVDYSEVSGDFPALGDRKITSLYKSYIQKATKDLDDCGYLVSVFKDNAGIVDFDSKLNVCVKVETHNSPSALDPFGGALTGILGVHRDILGCGLGAKPVANTDVFCLSTPNLFPEADSPQRPELLKDPGVIFRGVHQGVEEGGNQSGIPTVNGAFCFSSEFAAKPLIFVGSVGVMPKTVHGRASESKEIRAGDLIVVAGGRLGKDGVHGATFSSLALHDNVASNVVQIGDSITQKRLLDFTLKARDNGWIQAITDNGAGGVSSSIGEMAQYSGGARMDLGLHPVKYSGLEYWEMLVSESQERMSYAVSPNHLMDFMNLARHMGVEAFVLGEFTDSGFFDIFHGKEPLAKLQLEFLHDGLSRMKLKAHFDGPKQYQEYFRAEGKIPLASNDLAVALKKVLANPNVASREPLVRYYDHEVQGATRVKPYGGKTQSGANDAGVLDLSVHGGDDNNAVAVSNGLCPQFSWYDTYLMAQKAVDESVRNLVATGADPAKMALVDNFCWPDPTPKASNPDAAHKMAQLVRACAGLYDAAVAYRAPFVSGKDSMKNDFIGKTKGGDTVKISVPPTLLVTAVAQVPDATKTAPGFFQTAGDLIYLLGAPTGSLYASVLSQEFIVQESAPEYPDLARNKDLYGRIYAAHQKTLLQSCHDISDGGLMTALAESGFGNNLGMKLNLESFSWNELWSETGSLFVVSVKPADKSQFEELFTSQQRLLGEVQENPVMSWQHQGATQNTALSELQKIWSEGVLNVYQA